MQLTDPVFELLPEQAPHRPREQVIPAIGAEVDTNGRSWHPWPLRASASHAIAASRTPNVLWKYAIVSRSTSSSGIVGVQPRSDAAFMVLGMRRSQSS